jgi:hypothetical protein
MGAILLVLILYLLGGLVILAITYWPVTLSLIILGTIIWLNWPRVLLATDVAVIRVQRWRALRKLKGLRLMAMTRMRIHPVDVEYIMRPAFVFFGGVFLSITGVTGAVWAVYKAFIFAQSDALAGTSFSTGMTMIYGPHWRMMVGVFYFLVVVIFMAAWPILRYVLQPMWIALAVRFARITINTSEWLTKQMMDRAARH